MPAPTSKAASPGHRAAVAVLLAAGVATLYGLFGRSAVLLVSLGPWGPAALAVFLLVLAGLVLLPSTANRLVALTTWTRATVARHRIPCAVAAGLATTAYLYASAAAQGRALRPYVHDEFSYLIQAHQFARGHLWMRPHPLGLFFDSFQLFADPVYASAYFPGTALLYVPGVWLHLPAWVTSLAVTGAVAGLLFHVVADVLDGAAAVVAMPLLWSDQNVRSLSTMVMGQLPLLMYGLAATAGWLAWRATGRHRWAAATGLALGLAAVTRPVDALCFAVPIATAVLVAVLSRRRSPTGLVVMAAAVVPMLLLQLALNRGITGRWAQTPFRLYADRDYPGTAYGFHPFDPAARPASPLPQKQKLYDEYRPLIREHRWPTAPADDVRALVGLMHGRLPLTLTQLSLAPYAVLIVVMPVALAGLTGRRAVVLAALPLFVAGYAGYVFYFSHYTATVAASLILAVLIAVERLPLLVSAGRAPAATAAALVAVAGLAVASLREFDPSATATDDLFAAPLIADVDRQLSTLGHRPAVVLFKYDPRRNTHEEPVYNADVAWPDDAAVVRAHDLGPAADAALFRYYAARPPDRHAYRYDEATRTLVPLGPVTELARGRG